MNICKGFILAFALAMTAPAHAELIESGTGGFTSRHVREFAAPPAEVYQALLGVSGWWLADHTWSGDPANLQLQAAPGGCFCEQLPDGGWVEHLRLVYLAPGRELRFRGALGPLQQMGMDGAMIWLLEPANGGTKLTWTYVVFGYNPGGLAEIGAAVDQVTGMQIDSLAALLIKQ